MATLREYFDRDPWGHQISCDWSFQVHGKNVSVVAKVALDLYGNAKYWYFYIPSTPDPVGLVASVLSLDATRNCSPSGEGGQLPCELEQESGYGEYPDKISTKHFIFTRRVHIYVDAALTNEEKSEISKIAFALEFVPLIRDHNYAVARASNETPLAFISHDSRDKEDIVRNLAIEMSRQLCPVWYDEFTLKVGDSLRASIEKGIKEARKCVVVLSPNFIGNDGWAVAEFDSIFTREIHEKKNLILPIWHNVTKEQVYQYSPRLADRVALSSSLGIVQLASRLAEVIKRVD